MTMLAQIAKYENYIDWLIMKFMFHTVDLGGGVALRHRGHRIGHHPILQLLAAEETVLARRLREGHHVG